MECSHSANIRVLKKILKPESKCIRGSRQIEIFYSREYLEASLGVLHLFMAIKQVKKYL